VLKRNRNQVPYSAATSTGDGACRSISSEMISPIEQLHLPQLNLHP
jgi:hypothetical protein